MDAQLPTAGNAASLPRKAACVELILQSYDDAVATRTLEQAQDGVRCRCSRSTRHPVGWGPRACEWAAHQKRPDHQRWARSQVCGRKLSWSSPACGRATSPAAAEDACVAAGTPASVAAKQVAGREAAAAMAKEAAEPAAAAVCVQLESAAAVQASGVGWLQQRLCTRRACSWRQLRQWPVRGLQQLCRRWLQPLFRRRAPRKFSFRLFSCGFSRCSGHCHGARDARGGQERAAAAGCGGERQRHTLARS